MRRVALAGMIAVISTAAVAEEWVKKAHEILKNPEAYPRLQSEREIPEVDVEGGCRSVKNDHAFVNLCIREEQMYFDNLRFSWRDTPNPVKHICLGFVASVHASGRKNDYYRDLVICVDNFNKVAKTYADQRGTTEKFRYR